MASPQSFLVVGWTVLGVLLLLSICLATFFIRRRKLAKAKKEQADLEQQNKNKTAEMAMQNQAQQQKRPISVLDPFTTQGAKKPTSIPQPFSMLRNPEAQVTGPGQVSKDQEAPAEQKITEVTSTLPSPVSLRGQAIRDSLDLKSLVSTPFSETLSEPFPAGWGKVV